MGCRWQERDAIGSIGPCRKSRLECVSEEIELDCGIAPLAVGIRAVNDFCFLRVKHQSTSREPLRKSDTQGFGLGLMSGSGRLRHPHTVQREQPHGSASSTDRTCNAGTDSLGSDLQPILAEFLHPEARCSHLPLAPAPSTNVQHRAVTQRQSVCARNALRSNSCGIVSKKALMSRSSTQLYRQQR